MNAQNQLDLSTLKLKDKKNLTVEELVSCIQEITNEKVSVESKKCFLKALSEKGETDEEFAIFIREFRKLSVNPELEDFAPNASHRTSRPQWTPTRGRMPSPPLRPWIASSWP